MCNCKDCKDITLLKGSDGVGIVSFTDNGDGTFTILLSNGNTYTSPNYTGPAGPTGAAGTNGTNAFKFIKEVTSSFDGDIITILRTDLESCEEVPLGCLFNEILSSFADLHVQVWGLIDGFWRELSSLGVGSSGILVNIDAITGDIAVVLNLPGLESPVLVRVVILA
jgi:hypothetical protein